MTEDTRLSLDVEGIDELLRVNDQLMKRNEELEAGLEKSLNTFYELRDELSDRIFTGWLAIVSVLANFAGIAYLIAHAVNAHGLWAGWWAR